MSTDQVWNTGKEFDIASGISIDTQYPVEKFLLKWKISNYSKIFNGINVHFFTTGKSTRWRLKFDKGSSENKIELWYDMYDNTHWMHARVHYTSVAKCCHDILQKEGMHEFKSMFNHYCSILRIPQTRYISNNDEKEVKFENDALNFQCTLTILGHTITRQTPLLNFADYSSKQIHSDLEGLFESKEHSDIIVSDGKNKIPAHKAILCARSPVFNIMFKQDMFETKNNEVVIDDIDHQTLEDFLLFLYSGKVKQLSWDTAMNLYYAADKYEVGDLREVCSDFLQMNLTTENACEVLKLADQHRDDDLKKSVSFFIQMNPSSVKLTQTWKDLARTHPKIIAEIFY